MIETVLIDTFSSTVRWFFGFLYGGLAAFLVGTALTTSRAVWRTGEFVTDFLRCVPILALVPLVQINLGPQEYSKILIIAVAGFFPICVSILFSVRSQSSDRLRFFRNLGLKRHQYWRVSTLESVFDGLKRGLAISVGVTWISVVAAELLGTYSNAVLPGGLGSRLDFFYREGNQVMLWFYAAIFGALGFASSFAMRIAIGSRQET